MCPEEKSCPYCGETIKAVAVKCKHCGEWLPTSVTPSVHPSPPSSPATTVAAPPAAAPPAAAPPASAPKVADHTLPTTDIPDVLAALVERSLAVLDPGTGRYRMMESVRQYSRDRLYEKDDGARWRDRHLEHFCEIAEQARSHNMGPDEEAWVERLRVEHENVRMALDWSSAGGGHREVGLRMAAALRGFWHALGLFAEGREWLTLLLSNAGSSRTAVRADALRVAGGFAWRQGDYLCAHELLEESLAIGRELGTLPEVASSLNSLGLVSWQLGDKVRAQSLLEESLEINREVGDRRRTAITLSNLGTVAHEYADYAGASRLYEEALSMHREVEDRRGQGLCLLNLGHAVFEEGDFSAAYAYYVECREVTKDLEDPLMAAELLGGFAQLAAVRRTEALAARLWGAEDRLREEIGSPVPLHARETYECRVSQAREVCGEAEFSANWQQGRDMTPQGALDLAVVECAKEEGPLTSL